MRIGIDGGCLANRRGFGRFARETIKALAEAETKHDFVVIVDRPSLDEVRRAIPDSFETIVVETRRAPSEAASAQGNRSPRDMLAMGAATARAQLNLLYFPATYTFFPVWNAPRVVVTMHDTLALRSPELVFSNPRGRLFWRMKEHAAAAWADRIATVSETAKRDLVDWFRLPQESVFVVPESVDPIFRPIDPSNRSRSALSRYGVDPDRPFVLYVGGLSPHKNIPRLIEAFARVDNSPAVLVLVGDLADRFLTEVPLLRSTAERFGIADRIVLTGYVPDTDLVHFYNSSLFLVQPSLMEGFGLPPVEAMTCGAAIAASRAGSLPEVVGNAGLYFDPRNIEEMASVLSLMIGDPSVRARSSARALERSLRFTRGSSARVLISVFEELSPLGRDGAARIRRPA